MTTAAELASYASSFPSFRNRIINGNFDIWQRGTSQTNAGYGSADRWFLGHTGSTKTASRVAFTVGQTEVPGNPKYYLRHVVSSVAGTGNHCFLDQRIEGVHTLAGQTATLSFWAKADSNKNIATEFIQYFGTGGSPSNQITGIQVVTHNLTTSWQKFTATVAIPFISGKTIGSDGNDLLELIFWFDAGSTYSARTNSLGQQSGTFDIAQVQLEEGTVPTPFEHRPYGIELALCQRYYYVVVDGSESTNQVFGTGIGWSTVQIEMVKEHPVEMRASPDLKQTVVTNGYQGKVSGIDINMNSLVTYKSTTRNVLLYNPGVSGVTAGSVYRMAINNVTPSPKIALEAEL